MYSVIAGDTFELISRKLYGIEEYALNLKQANPGAREPLQAGTSLITPIIPGKPENTPQTLPIGSPEETTILIEGKRFSFWTESKLTRALDNVDTLELSAPFEPTLPYFKETFRPFSFKPIEVLIGGVRLFKGTMVTVTPTIGESKTMQVSAYSTPGVLNDCTEPESAYPIEYNGLGLKAIALAAVKPFGLGVVFTASEGAVFERVAMDEGQRVMDFLSDLAKQRNLVISSTENGELLFQRSVTTGTPVAKLKQGESPLISITPTFNPQDYYSHITGIEPVVLGLDGGAYTVKNGNLENLVRPFTFKAKDTENGTLQDAVKAKAGRMFGNMVSYKVVVNTWRDPSGKLWKPNTLLNLQSDNAMIYKPYNLVIRSVEFSRDSKSQSATLDLVIPGSFSGELPKDLPWD